MDDTGPEACEAVLAELDGALRRPYLTRAGVDGGSEPLLLCAHVRDTVGRAQRYTDETGLAGDGQVFSDPVVSIPLPLYQDRGDGGPVVFGSPVPAAYWHPLAWLGEDQSLPAELDGPDGDTIVETEREWAMRLCLQLQGAGLYDPDRGWVDVLALNGIDVASADGQGRVAAWLGGGADAVLDGIDLSRYFDAAEGLYGDSWAHQRTLGTFDAYQAAAWSMAARTMASDVAEAGDAGVAREPLTAVASLSAQFLQDAPGLDALGGEAPEDVLMDVLDRIDPDPGEPAPDQAALAAAAEQIRRVLEAVAEEFAGDEAALADAEEALARDLDALAQERGL